VAEAIFGLIGVFIGAVVTGGVDFLRQRRAVRREGKRARRLIGSDLGRVNRHLELLTENRAVPLTEHESFFDRYFSPATWQTYAPDLAVVLSHEDWVRVDLMYDFLVEVRTLLLVRDRGDPLNEEALESIQRGADEARHLRDQLLSE
jgi:hypothetical protein